MDVNLKEHIGKDGKKISPKLKGDLKNFVIDIDGVVSEDIPNEESERMKTAYEIPGSKEQINKWFDEGHMITFFTARTETEREVTVNWLKKHGYKFHNIIFGKPRGGNYHYIDDKHVRASTFAKWGQMVKKKVEIQVFE